VSLQPLTKKLLDQIDKKKQKKKKKKKGETKKKKQGESVKPFCLFFFSFFF